MAARSNQRRRLRDAGGEARRGRVRRGGIALRTVLALVLLAGLGAAPAAGPTAQIRGAIDRTLEILKRPDLKSKARAAERRDFLRNEIKPVFDFEEMSRRSLGPSWRQRTPKEKADFVGLFTELLENAYLGKIESYQGEKIEYAGETVDLPYAVVKTLIVTTKSQEVQVDYRMIRNGDQWRIYDVVIEGISLVNNYRSQFGSILQNSSFDQLLSKLRSTIKRQQS